MPKNYTFPTLFDELRRISITKLKEWGYMEGYKSGTIYWSRNGERVASISILVNTIDEKPYVELDYTWGDKPINYKILLEKVSSNLGKGFRWYFRCPFTDKLCMKLYLHNGYFMHREAITGGMYSKQTYSQQNRALLSIFEKDLGTDKLYGQLYSKYFKRIYAGRPTKRYLKLMKKIEKSEQLTVQEIEKMYLYR